MKIFISGKHIDVGDSLRAHIEDGLKTLISRFFKDAVECQVTLSKDTYQFSCDLSVHISRHFVVRTQANDTDAYRCFELALSKMESRMTRYRSRLRNSKRQSADKDYGEIPASQYVLNTEVDDQPEADVPLIIAEMNNPIHTVTVSEAVMQMDLSDQSVLMFRNPSNGQFNIVYRRRDGHIGWIDPSK